MKTILTICALALGVSACTQQEGGSAEAKAALPTPSREGQAAGSVEKVQSPAQRSWDGPFGFQMGLTKEQVRAEYPSALEQGTTLLLTQAPKPYPLFDGYGLFFGSSGLCKVVGMKADFETDSGGIALRGRVDTLATELEARYGRGAKRDLLMTGSIWKEPQEWVAALQRQERTYTYTWLRESGAKLPDNIQAIAIETKARARDRGQVILTYEFSNFDQCLGELKGKQQAGL